MLYKPQQTTIMCPIIKTSDQPGVSSPVGEHRNCAEPTKPAAQSRSCKGGSFEVGEGMVFHRGVSQMYLYLCV